MRFTSQSFCCVFRSSVPRLLLLRTRVIHMAAQRTFRLHLRLLCTWRVGGRTARLLHSCLNAQASLLAIAKGEAMRGPHKRRRAPAINTAAAFAGAQGTHTPTQLAFYSNAPLAHPALPIALNSSFLLNIHNPWLLPARPAASAFRPFDQQATPPCIQPAPVNCPVAASRWTAVATMRCSFPSRAIPPKTADGYPSSNAGKEQPRCNSCNALCAAAARPWYTAGHEVAKSFHLPA
jgi:hypothetical protein